MRIIEIECDKGIERISSIGDFINRIESIKEESARKGYPLSLMISSDDNKHVFTSVGGEYSFILISAPGDVRPEAITDNTLGIDVLEYLHLDSLSEILSPDIITSQLAIKVMTDFVNKSLIS